jgi:Outer membrane lipoprotein-sorting protein
MNVQNPITKTTIVDLASADDTFCVWLPRDNRLYEGRNSAREFELDSGPSFTAKPVHILEAILPPMLSSISTGVRISLKEERDAANKYYVVSLYRDAARNRLEPVRDIWVERANLTIARQQFFGSSGEVISNVTYSGWETTGSVRMPLRIVIERPSDGYSLDLQFRSWNINPDLPDSAFTLQPPQDAERVLLKEKRESR